jgi:electron transport complex protein RnfB
MNLIQRIDALLPQTQCGKCGHPGCRPYAESIVAGEAINKCPPGGDETIAGLAQLLNVPVLRLDAGRGHAPAQVAFIREAECIGCTKCIQACPVDAIVGAAKLMHTVIVQECTGCDLCVAPCPVDCIDMLPLPAASVPFNGDVPLDSAQLAVRTEKRDRARQRAEARVARVQREERRRQTERQARPLRTPAAPVLQLDPAQAALARIRSRPSIGGDSALKQARAQVAMSRAQLLKSLKAFGHPPIAEQAAQLVQLQRGLEEAEHTLARLQNPVPAASSSQEKPLP